jgi:undecaprenyl-diphosphatase
MDYRHQLADFFLLFSNEPVILPLIIFGITCYNRQIFSHALIILLFTMVFSAMLKSIFKVPLNPALGLSGYAFPSGHMQSSIVFYGWLFYSISNKLVRYSIIGILFGVAYGLVYRGYHNIIEILGALFFASITLFFYNYAVTKNAIFKERTYLLAIATITLSLLLIFIMYIQLGFISPHIWKVIYILLGFSIASYFTYTNEKIILSLRGKISSLIFIVITLLTIFYISKSLVSKDLPLYIRNIQWLLIGAIIPLSAKFNYIGKK